MYFSRIELDMRKRSTMKAISSPSLFHGAIESSFEGERNRRLWRIDKLGGHTYLLVLSEDKPDFFNFAKQFCSEKSECPWQTKSYDMLLDKIEDGTKWHFRLVANPTISKKTEKKSSERGKIYAHITPYYQKKWLLDRCENNGFMVCEHDLYVTQSVWKRFYKNGNKLISFLSVTYEGMLSITDSKKFKACLQDGIGRGKAYGMGLLTVVQRG